MKSLLALLSLTASSLLAAGKPNVLFLFADDMRADSIAALGNPAVRTPTLDSLVNRGFSFSNAFCLGGNSAAVCTPSRNMLLSGRAYFRWQNLTDATGKKRGAMAPGDAPNFPLSMKDAGYATYHEGKKGNTAINIQAKFDRNVYINEDADRNSGEPGKVIADDAIEFLKAKKDEKPFFMYLAFGNPHDPRVAAQKYLDLYERPKIPLPPDYLPQHPFDNGEMVVRDEQLSPWPRTEDEIRRHLHEYYAVITALDRHMGRIIAALEEMGQLDNTIVLFSADQGIAIGSHGLLGKQNLYNSGMKVPLIFAGPGVTKGSSDALVYLLDVYPTVCEFAGAPAPAGIDGISFKPVMDGRAKTTRDELFLSYQLVQRAVIADGWKLIRYPQINRSQLFHVADDPYELKDLAAAPQQNGRVIAMTSKLKKWQQHYGDELPIVSEAPKPAEWAPPKAGQLKPAGRKKKQKAGKQANGDGAGRPIRVALFDDAGSAGKGVPKVSEQLGADPSSFAVTLLKGPQIGDGTLKKEAFDVVVFTGGSGSKQSKTIGEAGVAAVHEFVKDGGGYVGICAGAYLACEGFSWGVKVLDAKTASPKWQRGVGEVKLEFTDKGREILGFPTGQLDVRYANGPIYRPAESADIPDFQPLAFFRTEFAKNGSPVGAMVNSPALVAGEFGKGRVICSSPHPEQTAGMESFIVKAVKWTAAR